MPSCSPFSSITRISRARIRSLMRIKDLAARLSNAMVLLPLAVRRRLVRSLQMRPPGQRTTEYSTGLVVASAGSVRAGFCFAQARHVCRYALIGCGLRRSWRHRKRQHRVSTAVNPHANQPIRRQAALDLHRQKVLGQGGGPSHAPEPLAGVCSVIASSSRPINCLRCASLFSAASARSAAIRSSTASRGTGDSACRPSRACRAAAKTETGADSRRAARG